MSADADRIAALEADLAEARGLPRQCASLGHTQEVGGFCAECSPYTEELEAALTAINEIGSECVFMEAEQRMARIARAALGKP
jgi:hypothetical protein